jgi:hypothetical protein
MYRFAAKIQILVSHIHVDSVCDQNHPAVTCEVNALLNCLHCVSQTQAVIRVITVCSIHIDCGDRTAASAATSTAAAGCKTQNKSSESGKHNQILNRSHLGLSFPSDHLYSNPLFCPFQDKPGRFVRNSPCSTILADFPRTSLPSLTVCT